MEINIIVALAANGVMGKDGALPWQQKEDMQHFKSLTGAQTLIMGRKTFESLGRLLPKRYHIVISDTLTQVPNQQPLIVKSLTAAIDAAKSLGNDVVWVIGGASVITEAFGIANNVYLTFLDGNPEGDTFLTVPKDWQLAHKKVLKEGKADANNTYDYQIMHLYK